MRRPSRLFVATGLTFALSAALSFSGTAAFAQAAPADERSIDVQLFHQAMGPHGFVTHDRARPAVHQQLSLSLMTNFQRSPCHITVESTQQELQAKFDVVHSQISSEPAA